MPYSVHEIFYTLQGEGANSGRPAVFCRFAGCNLWSGREEDRTTADCPFCDTGFVGTGGPGGGKFDTPERLASAIVAKWPLRAAAGVRPFVVCTGGEPLLQVDSALIDALHQLGVEIAVETNGTKRPPPGIDWICVSPKGGEKLLVTSGDELKLAFPQPGISPEMYQALPFRFFSLQPMDGPDREVNTKQAIEYCLRNPRWTLSVQMHKILGVP
jgi:7-carboxy-7-deazaguanine synthase